VLSLEWTKDEFEDSKIGNLSMGFFPFSFAKNFDEDDLISMQGWF
jgi:hypothetical protein